MDSLENKILQMISKNKMTKRDDIQNCSHQGPKSFSFCNIITDKSSPYRQSFKKSSQQWREGSTQQKQITKNNQRGFNANILQQQSFKKNWERFKLKTKNHINFSMMTPFAISQSGQQMLKDGMFLTWWLKILQTSQFINIKAIGETAYEKFFKKLEKNQQVFFNYCKSLYVLQRQSNFGGDMQTQNENDLNRLQIVTCFKKVNRNDKMQQQIDENRMQEQDSSHIEKHSSFTSAEFDFQTYYNIEYQNRHKT